jgi:hypothetical protein
MRRATRAICGVGIVCAIACGRKPDGAAVDAGAPLTMRVAGERVVPVDESDRSSSALALANVGARRVAILADEDDARLRVLSIPDGKELASTKIGGAPGHVIVDKDGIVWVSVRNGDALQAFSLSCTKDACDLVATTRVPTAAEPIALALAPDGRSIFVACAWAGSIEQHALPGGEKIASAVIAPNARAIVVAKNGDLVVSHATGSIVTIVSTSAGMPTRAARLDYRDHVHSRDEGATIPIADEPRFADQGYALARLDGAVLAPMIVAYPGEPFVETSGYGSPDDAYFPHETAIAVIDPDAPTRIRARASVFAADESRVSRGRVEWPKETRPCLLPRAAAVDASRRSILVACEGIDEIAEIDADPKPLLSSMRNRWAVPKGPVAIAMDATHHEAFVWSQLDRTLSKINSTVDVVAKIAPDTQLDPDWLAGRVLFHTPIAFDGRACASCHPDGRSDGLTWSSPKGPMQTPMLAGRIEGNAPFGWLGDGATVETHLRQTLKNLQAKAISDDELRALATFASKAKTNLAERERTKEEERGRAIFDGKAGCTQCHHEGGRSGDGARHDVGTGGLVDTPSLRFVGGTAPYMHDGRYATLREVLVKTDGKMGTTKHLSEPDVLALIAYLRSI